MSQDELLPEELNDCRHAFESLLPRTSRIDRDRLMIRLGQESAARASRPWKWSTAAALLLAVGLGLRPALVQQAAAPGQVARDDTSAAPRAPEPSPSQSEEQDKPTRRQATRPVDNRSAWLQAVASGRFDSSRVLSVRPRLTEDALATRAPDAPGTNDSPAARSSGRAPVLRWGDRLLNRDLVEPAGPPAS